MNTTRKTLTREVFHTVDDVLEEIVAFLAHNESPAEIAPDLYIVRTTRQVAEGICELVTAGFRDVVTTAWEDFDLPVRFLLPD